MASNTYTELRQHSVFTLKTTHILLSRFIYELVIHLVAGHGSRALSSLARKPGSWVRISLRA
jgi:hypothetical protein